MAEGASLFRPTAARRGMRARWGATGHPALLAALMGVVEFAGQKFGEQGGGFLRFFEGREVAAGGQSVEMRVRQVVRQGFADGDRDQRVIGAPQHECWHRQRAQAGDGVRPGAQGGGLQRAGGAADAVRHRLEGGGGGGVVRMRDDAAQHVDHRVGRCGQAGGEIRAAGFGGAGVAAHQPQGGHPPGRRDGDFQRQVAGVAGADQHEFFRGFGQNVGDALGQGGFRRDHDMRFEVVAEAFDDRGVERLVAQQSGDEDDLCFAVGQLRAPINIIIGEAYKFRLSGKAGMSNPSARPNCVIWHLPRAAFA